MNLSYTPAQVNRLQQQAREDTERAVAKWLRDMKPHVSPAVQNALDVLANCIESGEYRRG